MFFCMLYFIKIKVDILIIGLFGCVNKKLLFIVFFNYLLLSSLTFALIDGV
jgi:hypothetical protein